MGQKLEVYLEATCKDGWKDDHRVFGFLADVVCAYQSLDKGLEVNPDDFIIGCIEGLRKNNVPQPLSNYFTDVVGGTVDAIEVSESGRPRGFKRAPGYVPQGQPRRLKRRDGGSS
ncbi:MAG TPA: hypothetical protein VJA47_03205 [archaeon]|nr:hypothetical protein [archaeon]